MSARSFGSLFMVASCAGAALGCYLVSLHVASERAALEDVETRIVLAQRDLRVLQTELGTRGRLSQLERWNAGAFALSAPSAGQFLQGGFELARLTQPERTVDFEVPVVLASAPAPQPAKPPIGEPVTDDAGAPAGMSPRTLIREASLKIETREVSARPAAELPPATAKTSVDRPVTAAKPVQSSAADKPGLAAAKPAPKPVEPQLAATPTNGDKRGSQRAAVTSGVRAGESSAAQAAVAKTVPKKSVDKPPVAAPKPMTKSVQLAKNDPPAPSPDKQATRPKDPHTGR